MVFAAGAACGSAFLSQPRLDRRRARCRASSRLDRKPHPMSDGRPRPWKRSFTAARSDRAAFFVWRLDHTHKYRRPGGGFLRALPDWFDALGGGGCVLLGPSTVGGQAANRAGVAVGRAVPGL